MRRSEYIGLAERLLEHEANNTTDSAEDTYTVPVADYLDEARWNNEMEAIFKRLPLMLAYTDELREPGSYKTIEAVGVPVLITRGKDGMVHAFLNVCSHRGAAVVTDECGTASRFMCPYHGWTFNDQGALIGVADKHKFGEVDTEAKGLKELACEERGGLIFVALTPGVPMDIEAHLGGMLDEIESLGIENWHIYKQVELPGANWKVCYDGYLEGYHFATLHTNTIFTFSANNIMAYDSYGPHQRIGFPHHNLGELRTKPQEEWETGEGMSVIRTLFPHVSMAGSDQGGLISQLIPGPTPEQSRTIQTYIYAMQPSTDEERAAMDASVEMTVGAVRDEDYATGFGIQKGMSTGANEEFTFGKNELGLHKFHQWVNFYAEGKPESERPNP
jgi:phenylpropionate dioxygenase-like ring-hydroxylating dioxygenase large terminal subunit